MRVVAEAPSGVAPVARWPASVAAVVERHTGHCSGFGRTDQIYLGFLASGRQSHLLFHKSMRFMTSLPLLQN
jgi:hypothetical protein